jgi:hypothetical protein
MASRITSALLGSMTVACMVWVIVSIRQPLQGTPPTLDPKASWAQPLPQSTPFSSGAPDAVQSLPDKLSEPLRSIEEEMGIVAYEYDWHPSWFRAYVEQFTSVSCGVEFSSLSREQQQSLMNIAAALVTVQLSQAAQYGLGDPNWVAARKDELSAAQPPLDALQPQLNHRLSQMLPSGKNWIADIADPTFEVLYIAARYDVLKDWEPAPPQFPAQPETLCEQLKPESTPQDYVPKRGPIRIAQRLAIGAIAQRPD